MPYRSDCGLISMLFDEVRHALGLPLHTTEAFRLGLPFMGAFLLLSLMVVGLSVPTPAGVGGFHASFQIGCTLFYGVPNDQAVAAAIVLHAILFVPVAIVGAILMAQDGLNLFRMKTIVQSRSVD